MSKSTGNVADPIQAISQYGVDVVRWYLARVGGRWRTDVGESMVNLLSDVYTTQSHQIGLNLSLRNMVMKFDPCSATTSCVPLLLSL